MKAVTLWQPYATAIALGVKQVETRPRWALRLRSMVGDDLAIHAGVRNPPPGQDFGSYRTARGGGRGRATELHQLTGPGPLLGIRSLVGVHPLPLGCVVAVARIAAVVRMVVDKGGRMAEPVEDGEQVLAIASRPWGPMLTLTTNDRTSYCWPIQANVTDQLPWGDFGPGRVAVVLEDVRPLARPVACRGYQQVWTLPDLAAAQVRLEASLHAARHARDELERSRGGR